MSTNGGTAKKQPPAPEPEIIHEPQEAITVRPEPLVLAPVMDIALAKRRLEEFQQFVRGYLVEGEDFGTIPGTAKPTLLKPGADKLCELYALSDSYRILGQTEDFKAEPALFDYTIECALYRNDRLVSTGLGSCNSYEARYRWREAQRTCPTCQAAAIIAGKEEYGGGYVCWKKKGGCGAAFKLGDQRIEGQQAGRVPNDDTASLKNTVLKMARKRAKIDATLAATRSSGIFTQDLEDTTPAEPVTGKPPIKPPTRTSARPTPVPDPEPATFDDPAEPTHVISAAQVKKFWGVGRQCGWSEDQLRDLLKRYGLARTADIPANQFDRILAELQKQGAGA